MSSRFLSYLSHFFPRHASVQLRELYLTFGLLDLATAAVSIFEPIYLFRLGYSVPAILSFFLAIYALYFAVLPLGGKFALRYGYAKSIFMGSFFLVAYYLSLLGLAHSVVFFLTAVPALAVQKMLYWLGFHAEFARYGDDHEEAREVSVREVIDVGVSVVGPLFGGLLLYLSNFATLFVVVSLLILLSNIPILLQPEIFAPAPFPYLDAYRRLLAPEYRRMVFSFFGYGEELIVTLLWPLYMYSFLNDLFSLGSLVAGTTLLTATVVLYVGRLVDYSDKRTVLKASSLGYAAVWVMRLFVGTIAGVFAVDALSRLLKRILEVPQLSLLYAHAREDHHIMRHAVLFEMSVVIGKIAAMVLAIGWLVFAPTVAWPAIFIMAAIFTLLYPLL